MESYRRYTKENQSPSSSPNARQSSLVNTTASFFTNQNKEIPSSNTDFAATNSSMIGANLLAQQELQLVDDYVLFHELYHYMTSLYQVMKTTVGASADVVAATVPAASGARQASTTRQSQANNHMNTASLTNRSIGILKKTDETSSSDVRRSVAQSPVSEALGPRKSLTQHLASIISSRQSSPYPAQTINRQIVSPDTQEDETGTSSDNEDHNVGKHYYLVLPPDDALRSLIVRCERAALPTFASSPEHRLRDRRSKSIGEVTSEVKNAGSEVDPESIPTTTLRIRHNVVRCHIFQGDRHRRTKRRSVEEVPIALTGLSGLSAELVFHLQSSATTESFTADPNSSVATVSITPVAVPLPSAAAVNTNINITGFDTIGNLTLLYAKQAVVQIAPRDGSSEHPVSAGNNNSFGASTTSPTNGSQMWWQRVPISVISSLPAECDPKPTECLLAAAAAEAENETLRADQDIKLHSLERQSIFNFSPEPQIATLFRQDEQRLTAVLIKELEPRGFPLDETLTSLDTEIGIFNSSYVCMKGFESFIVSKVSSIVEAAQENLVGYNASSDAHSAVGSTKDISRTALMATSPVSAPHMLSSSARSRDDSSYQNRNLTDEEEEQVEAVLHVMVTSGIALKINEHWASVNSVDDYAFYHACVSLRKSIQKRLVEFLPDICVGKVTIATFSDTIRICKYIDAPEASLFSIMRAMEGAINSIVTLVTNCCEPGKTHEVTADVCIPLVVLVLILAALNHLPSRIRLILEFIVPVLELSSLGYALTTFEASAEQIHQEYALMVKNQ